MRCETPNVIFDTTEIGIKKIADHCNAMLLSLGNGVALAFHFDIIIVTLKLLLLLVSNLLHNVLS
jgi:hypothetical protein